MTPGMYMGLPKYKHNDSIVSIDWSTRSLFGGPSYGVNWEWSYVKAVTQHMMFWLGAQYDGDDFRLPSRGFA